MTIIEAINKLDKLKPNAFSQTEKVAWLSLLDNMIKRDVIDTHEDATEWTPYTEETPLSTELLAGYQYADMYVKWLEAKVDYYNGEYSHYNTSILMFDELYANYQNDYNRHHMPITKEIRYIG